MTGPLEPLARESSASIIAERIRAGIMEGLFQPGERMGEIRLAEQLNVSRGLLREAMQRLVQEGLLRSERYRGLFVVEFDDEDVWDIYLARESIERAAVRAILHRTDADLAAMANIVKQMVSAARRRRGSSLAELDLQFHAALVDASGSPRLRRVMQSLLVETSICLRGLETRYQDPSERVAEHEQILEALVARDESRALRLVSDHMNDAVERLAKGGSDDLA